MRIEHKVVRVENLTLQSCFVLQPLVHCYRPLQFINQKDYFKSGVLVVLSMQGLAVQTSEFLRSKGYQTDD